jgi:hypothetical protein
MCSMDLATSASNVAALMGKHVRPASPLLAC